MGSSTGNASHASVPAPSNLRKTGYTSLFTTLIIFGSYVSVPVPVSPVPIVLANFFVILAGLLLGKWWASGSAGLYLFIGALGFPVFSGGRGGLSHLLGPTGGYLLGYLVCSFVIGFIIERGEFSWYRDLIASIIGYVIIFAIGLPWLKFALGISWGKSFTVGLFPFLIGAGLKIIVALGLVRVLRPYVARSRRMVGA
ncbi:MAG: biotin transporter BioY [bacterium]|nr:biotin transporter BioY [bacterium]